MCPSSRWHDKVVERVYALDDPLNITAIIDGTTGAVLERYGFTGFGTPNYMDASFGSLSGSAYDWETLFASYRYDTDTGLYQVRNRFYHPNLGRWPIRDPIGEAGGINLYAYVLNNATNAVDPLGLVDASGSASQCQGLQDQMKVMLGLLTSAANSFQNGECANSGVTLGDIFGSVSNVLQNSNGVIGTALGFKSYAAARLSSYE